MQSFIILSTDKKNVQEHLVDLAKKEQISQFDILQITQEEESSKKKSAKKSLGIETIKSLQQDVFLTPVQGKKKLIVIHDAFLLTVEAQNALLKLLEEPPVHLLLILVTNSLNSLLPTIQSRCFIINLTQNERVSPLSEEEKTFWQTLSRQAIFEVAEKKGKTKEEAIEWSKRLIEQFEQELHVLNNTLTIQQYTNLLRKLLKIHQTVSSTNISPRMTIESILLAPIS